MLAHHSETLSRSLDVLTGYVAGTETLEDTLNRVSELGIEALDGADMTGITLLEGDRATTAVFSDPTSPEIDSVQYATGKGPCLDASRRQQIFRIDSTTDDQRWVEFCEAAAAKEIYSVLSCPLSVNGKGLGALNFYSRTPGAFSDDDEELGSLFARQASVALANASAFWGATALAEQLKEALTSRAVIDQAKGIIMGAQGCSADEAFDVLRRASQRENTKLSDIAQGIVERVQSRVKERHPSTPSKV